MSLLALLLAAQAAPASEVRVEQTALLETFQSACLAPGAELGTLTIPAVTAGFYPTTVMPTGFEWVELAAWQRGGVRLFRMTDSREASPRPMCGVSASLARPAPDQQIVDTVATISNAVFGECHSANGISITTLGRRGGGAIMIDIDRSRAPNVRVRLVAWQMSS